LSCLALPAQAAALADALALPARAARRPAHSVQLALASAGSRVVAVGERGVILLSDDAGRTWRQAQTVPVSVTLTAVHFASPTRGYAAGHSGVLLQSQDGGETWTRRLQGHEAATLVLQAAQALPASATQPRVLAAAQRLVDDGPDKPWLALHFSDAQHGLLLGAYNLALQTADGGTTWQALSPRLDNPQSLHLYTAASQGPAWLLAGEQGLLLQSRNGGASFERLASPYKGSYFTAQPLPDGEWLVAGLRGNVWRSSQAGQQWTQLEGLPPINITVSTRLADGRLLLVNQAGMGFVSADQGHSLQPLALPPGPPLADLLALPDGALVSAGFGGVHRVDLPTSPTSTRPAR
jgi:photosystem II stability/assembly factor-like uncharacterized protein